MEPFRYHVYVCDQRKPDDAGDNISKATAEGQGAAIFLGFKGGKATAQKGDPQVDVWASIDSCRATGSVVSGRTSPGTKRL